MDEIKNNERPDAAARREDLMKAAFDVVALHGFEGLRTRLVADKAGVNVATLHYYFPTKEALIEALAEYLGTLFVSTHAPAPASTGRVGLDRLRQEFANSAYYMTQQKELMSVMAELGQRAGRDPAVGRIIGTMVGYWRQNLAEMVAVGVADGSFRKDLDTEEVTATLVSIFSGLSVVGPAGVDGVRRAVEQWLVAPEG